MTATVHIKTDFLQMCTVFVKNKMFGWDVDVMEGRFCRKKKMQVCACDCDCKSKTVRC